MEVLTSQGLLISPNVAIPVTGPLDDSSKDSSEESSPQSDTSSAASAVGSTSSTSLTHSASTVERRKDSKWTKSTQPKSQLPINLISTTNQQKVSQNIPIKQQIPLKLASRLSASGGGGGNNSLSNMSSNSGPQQMLPLKLSQDEKVRRTSTSGYQRLGSDSFSPPSGETVFLL